MQLAHGGAGLERRQPGSRGLTFNQDPESGGLWGGAGGRPVVLTFRSPSIYLDLSTPTQCVRVCAHVCV